MFIPLYDANGLEHIKVQFVTIGLIVVNVAVWLVTDLAATQGFSNHMSLGLGFIPAVVFDHARLPPDLVIVPEGWTFLSYAFLHGNFMHLAGNMIFLWVFGDNVEDAMGHVRFLIFYLLAAAAAALVHGLLIPDSEGPLIGASGAISAVVAAYFLLHPKVRVWVLVLWRIPLPLPAAIPLAFWIGQQFYMLVVGRDSAVSWAAHVGGIVAGLLLVVVFRRRGVPLFDRAIVTPRAVVHKGEPPAAEPQPGNPVRWGRPEQ